MNHGPESCPDVGNLYVSPFRLGPERTMRDKEKVSEPGNGSSDQTL